MMASNQGYSDLQVVNVETPNQPGEFSRKETINHPETLWPQVVPGQQFKDVDSSPYDPPNSNVSGPQRVCSLPKRTFYIVVAVALVVVIAAIAGGVAGGILANRSQEADAISNNNGTNSHVLRESHIATSNWTDPTNGQFYKRVFFQDINGALMASDWNSGRRTWRTINMTDNLSNANGYTNPRPGSPLASAARGHANGGYSSNVYYLAADNTIRWAHLPSGLQASTQWQGAAPESEVNVKNVSQLAAINRGCVGGDGCVDEWVLAFQWPNGTITVVTFANASSFAYPNNNYDDTPNGLKGTLAAKSASLAITGGIFSSPDRLVLASEEYTGRIGKTVMHSNETLTDATDPEIFGGDLFGTYDVGAMQLAATVLDDPPRVMYLAGVAGGEIGGAIWTGERWIKSTIEFEGGPPANFSAFAATADAMFYGIADDQIVEYRIDQTGPVDSPFQYVGRVWPPED